MIPLLREDFNKRFTVEKYDQFVHDLNEYAGEKIPFRIAESPVFIPALLKQKLVHACEEIISVIKRPDFKSLTERAIPDGFRVPGDEGESCASPHSKRQLQAIRDLRTVYGLGEDVHASRRFERDQASA